ncbi:MAG: hypothetical protein IIY94_05270 [Oscillospiraceae bacterium]|nr:hypothetical protein [Oscillospiraceae bacterium]
MDKRKTLRFALLALAISLLVELLFFNLKPLSSLGSGSWTPLPEPIITGDFASDLVVTLQYTGLDQEIPWCHFAVGVCDKDGNTVRTQLVIQYSDEGNANAYKAGTVNYTLAHDHASYFRLNSYGKIHDLSVRIEALSSGCSYWVAAAEINGSVPFHISVPRICGLFALLLLFWFLQPASPLHDNRLWNRFRWVKGVFVLLLVACNAFVCFKLICSNDMFVHVSEDGFPHHQQYAKLARALAEGKTWIETPEQESVISLLQQLNNPYDRNERAWLSNNHVTPPWDTAFYGEHLYVYFGVVPVLLGYLPYYLITGSDLPTYFLVWVCFVLILFGAFACMRALIRRHFPKTPFSTYVLLSLLLGNCTGVLFYTLEATFYIVPVFLALAFVLLALALWLSAAERWEKACGATAPLAAPETLCFAPVGTARPAGIGLRIVLGALLAALVAGCRPQFLVFSALALPIFGPFLRKEERHTVTSRRIVLFVLPYIAVAIPLMYYNYIRFGSPFDFGANYNLTTNDMRLRGFKLTRLPDGLFAYLFALPNLKLQFPYLYRVDTTPIYLGTTILEPMFGGSLVIFPFLWLLGCARRVWALLCEKKLRLFFLLPVLLALIVIIADTEMAGILWRYTCDYLALLYLSASIIYLALLEQAHPQQRRKLLVFLSAVTVFTMALCLLIALNASFLELRAPNAYFRFQDLLRWG